MSTTRKNHSDSSACPTRRLGRRGFLKGAAVLAVPCLVPSRVLGRDGQTAPSGRITVGLIGHGAMGRGHLLRLAGDPEVELLAVCDVDRLRREEALRRAGEIRSETRAAGTYRACKGYNDYRELFARPDIDAVVIATPDHWHTLQAIHAAKAGKDIYCEKPVSVTIGEGRRLVRTVRRFGRVFQTGTQYRSIPKIRAVCEFVRAGGLGKIKSAFTLWQNMAWTAPRFQSAAKHTDVQRIIRSYVPVNAYLPADPLPDGLDWDLWVGPASWQPYNRLYHVNPSPGVVPWAFAESFGTVSVTWFHSHAADVIQYALGMETQRAGRDHSSRQRPLPNPYLPVQQRRPAAPRGALATGDRPLQGRSGRGPLGRQFRRSLRGRARLADFHDHRRTPRRPAGTALPGNEAQKPRGDFGQWASRQLVRLHPATGHAQRVRGVGSSSGFARPPGNHRLQIAAVAKVGPGQGRVHRRRRSEPPAGPRLREPWYG